MIRSILTATLLIVASAAPAQQRATRFGSGDSRIQLGAGGIRMIYGSGALDNGSTVSLRVGSGRMGECGTTPWTAPKANVVSIEEVGQCRVAGSAQPVKQYRITLR